MEEYFSLYFHSVYLFFFNTEIIFYSPPLLRVIFYPVRMWRMTLEFTFCCFHFCAFLVSTIANLEACIATNCSFIHSRTWKRKCSVSCCFLFLLCVSDDVVCRLSCIHLLTLAQTAFLHPLPAAFIGFWGENGLEGCFKWILALVAGQ